MEIFISADVETDGPIPGNYSMLSFAFVYAGSFDGTYYDRPVHWEPSLYRELKPISTCFQQEAIAVNGLNRDRLLVEGTDPAQAMQEAYDWIMRISGSAKPVLVAYPLSFDWMWLYWYFMSFCSHGSPFAHSRCYDVKTAYAVKSKSLISKSGRDSLPDSLRSRLPHSHNALDDAREQAEVFANLFAWEGVHEFQVG